MKARPSAIIGHVGDAQRQVGYSEHNISNIDRDSDRECNSETDIDSKSVSASERDRGSDRGTQALA